MSNREVVVTGLGASSPLGGDVATTWSALLEGRSGITSLPEEWHEKLPVHFAGLLAEEPSEKLERHRLRRLDRTQQLALITAREAWDDAGSPEVDPLRLGVVMSSGIGGILTTLHQYDIFREKGWKRVSPFTVPMLMPNSPAAAVALEFTARAGAHAAVSACASSAEAIADGINMIRSGRADVVIAGGCEAAIHPLNIAAFAAMRALSTRNDDPQGASRPFTSTGTVSSWVRGQPLSSWSRLSTLRPAGPACTRWPREPDTPATPTTLCSLTRSVLGLPVRSLPRSRTLG